MHPFFPTRPGQFSMHDVYLVHGSNANTSPRRRAGQRDLMGNSWDFMELLVGFHGM
jgi:ectoine hydroxylase-related dioxygenase (phytanoyl-CoA dioxygenase family)